RAREQLPNRRDRTDPHHTWVDAGDRAPDEPAERLDAELASLLLARDHERGGAVVDPARVSGRHGPVRAKRGLERRELLRRRVGPRMLVALETVDRNELVVEPARVCRRSPALLRPKAEGVLLVTRDVPPLRDVFAGLAHRLERKHLLEPRIRKTPAERRVPHRLIPT